MPSHPATECDRQQRKRGLEPIVTPPAGLTTELLVIYAGWPERFATKVAVTEDCWEWQACKVANGYGRYARHGARDIVYPHRYVIELEHGLEALEGMYVDHLCRNQACVRPDHIQAVTPAENVRRGAASNAASGWCRAGAHRWVAENIKRRGTSLACVPCEAAAARRRSRAS